MSKTLQRLKLIPEPPLLKPISVVKKLQRFLALTKRVVSRPKAQSGRLESAEEISPSVSYEAESEEAAAPLEEPPTLPIEVPPSQTIFIAIGKTLCQRRESLSLTLDEIERHTHVGKHYLQALEAGEFGRLPSSVQARGMLNNYAHFLDLDVDALLLTFAEGLQTQRLERQPKPAETPKKPGLKFPFTTIPRLKIKIPASIRRYLSSRHLRRRWFGSHSCSHSPFGAPVESSICAQVPHLNRQLSRF